MTAGQREAFDLVVERSAMRSLPVFVHGGAQLHGPGRGLPHREGWRYNVARARRPVT
jgi:hypothetical protein